MKKVLVLMLVLGMASLANAGLLISVNGIVDPPDSTITIRPSESVILDIWGDGQTGGNTDMFVLVKGLGSVDGGGIVNSTWQTPQSLYQQAEQAADSAGIPTEELLAAFEAQDLIYINLASTTVPTPKLSGTLVDGVVFHCEGQGDVNIVLLNFATGEVMDTQLIHQIPEPATLAILGLGGLLLRRKK
jgi:hypothetical protein